MSMTTKQDLKKKKKSAPTQTHKRNALFTSIVPKYASKVQPRPETAI